MAVSGRVLAGSPSLSKDEARGVLVLKDVGDLSSAKESVCFAHRGQQFGT